MTVKIFTILLLLCFSLELSSVSSQPIPNFDGLVLAQQWKRSSCCSVNKLSSPSPNCNHCQLSDSASDWTIHGLWPTDSTRKNKVEYCHNPVKSISFNKYPANLYNSMKKVWPNVAHGANNNENFWWYQWKKHGTCALGLPATSNHQSYFSKTVDLYNQHQVGHMLENAGIVPKKSYTIGAIYTALQNNMQNQKPVVRCLKNGQISYLQEVYMCFTKQFTLKNCNANSNCPKSVYYP